MRALISMTLLGFMMSACQGATGDGPSSDAETTEPSFGRSVFASPAAASHAGKATMTISGRFASDSVEGGCAFLETSDGSRFEVLYPPGWEMLRNPFRLKDPSGEIVAEGIETVTVRGSIADDMVSTCQIGPIFRAVEVVTIDR